MSSKRRCWDRDSTRIFRETSEEGGWRRMEKSIQLLSNGVLREWGVDTLSVCENMSSLYILAGFSSHQISLLTAVIQSKRVFLWGTTYAHHHVHKLMYMHCDSMFQSGNTTCVITCVQHANVSVSYQRSTWSINIACKWIKKKNDGTPHR